MADDRFEELSPSEDKPVHTKEAGQVDVRALNAPLPDELVAPFSQWIDQALADLENRFFHLIRPTARNKFGR